MNATHYNNTRSSEWIGDMTVWLRSNASDNEERLCRLRRNLKQVREKELTPRQRKVLELHYEQGLSGVEIAEELGINPSTVSRTLSRARERLRRYLQYSL